MAESLVDLVLLAPEGEQARLLASASRTSDTHSSKRLGRSQGMQIRCNDGRARLLSLPVTNRNDGQNLSCRVRQTKAVGFSPGVALGHIRGAGLRGCDRLAFGSHDTDFFFDGNGSSQPID